MGQPMGLFVGVPPFGRHDDEWPVRADMLWPLFLSEPQDFAKPRLRLRNGPGALMLRPIHVARLLLTPKQPAVDQSQPLTTNH